MEMVSLSYVEKLIDFDPTNSFEALAKQQLKGSVALYNNIIQQNYAYLADEVGMGKTYVALGVVALMRFFNPNLKVLYISPKNNVRSKWIKDYKSFVEKNYKLNDLRVKSLDNQPATPFIECKNLESLINASTIGNYSDFFITSSAMSFGLSDHQDGFENELKKLRSFLPGYAAKIPEKEVDKSKVKDFWAQVINQVIPTFDLVVVDEAHNFKNGFSDNTSRNRVMGQILGTNIIEGDDPLFTPIKRLKNCLLLSATPYDRNIKQLENQLRLFVRNNFKLKKDDLAKFMVRRLNELWILDKAYTRNQYRIEHRTGEEVEVEMTTSQKLVSALVQKKVMQELNASERYKGEYQTGMLASFETYNPGARNANQPITDSDDSKVANEESADENVLTQIINSHKNQFNKLPPHPKMDWVAKQKANAAFQFDQKQLIFVRRIKSVTDLKEKFDEEYDAWLYKKLKQDLGDKHELVGVFENYLDSVIRDSEKLQPKTESKESEEQSKENFFRLFYFGKKVEGLDHKLPMPDDFKVSLTSKDRQQSTFFEFNWYLMFRSSKVLNQDLNISLNELILHRHDDELVVDSKPSDPYSKFIASQYLFLKNKLGEDHLLTQYYHDVIGFQDINLAQEDLLENLNRKTFFSEVFYCDSQYAIKIVNFINSLFLSNAELFAAKLNFFKEVLFYLFRQDHPVIDLYSSFLKANPKGGKWSNQINDDLLKELLDQLNKDDIGLSTSRILLDLIDHFELILKLNFEDWKSKSSSEVRTYINNQLAPLKPVIGASGDSGNKSAIARRFRMPGYPMIIVSTNVLQEGEDLHTFCDSVTHYGVSASPIVIEQKNGRVDRIGGLAQRRLLKVMNHDEVETNKIKVFFPYIKESIEFGQMYQLAHDMNDFIYSLNGIESPDLKNEKHNVNHLLRDFIPQQYSERLVSSLKTSLDGINDSQSNCNLLELEKSKIKNRDELLKALFSASFRKGVKHVHSGVIESGRTVRSMRHFGEMLVSFTGQALNFSEVVDSEYQSGTARFIMENSNSDQVFKNSEAYIGIDGELNAIEVEAIQRGLYSNTSEATKKCDLSVLLKEVKGTGGCEILSSFVKDAYEHLAVEFFDAQQIVRLTFHPSNKNLSRSHAVKWSQDNSGFIRFETNVINHEKLKEISRYFKAFQNDSRGTTLDYSNVKRFLMRRNRDHDIVNFYLTAENGIAVRIDHPDFNLHAKEFMLACYLVASRADRLEFLFNEKDLDGLSGDD